MKHRIIAVSLTAVLLFSCIACSGQEDTSAGNPGPEKVPSSAEEAVLVTLSDTGVTTTDENAVHTGDEIIYYKNGTDETYGEGEEHDKHSAEEAAAHTVVTITQPGTYRLTGTLSKGQIFVDLGEDAKRNPEAVVTVILDNVDVTCTVAPALLFYRVFECNTEWVAYDEEETADYQASSVADTSAAGANVIIAAGSENNFTGSHVARIYKEGTTKKLHKYDGAFYSRMSLNIYGENGDDSGVLSITADNEGLDSEMHLTIHGGNIYINSQDDGINTNEDYVSVTTINGGSLMIEAGRGAEGDGIDSNGYLTINGGTVYTASNERTPDGGIDADGAITINGGTLYAFGTRNDAADRESSQPYMELSFASTLPKGSKVEVKDEAGSVLWGTTTFQSCQAITLTTPGLKLDTVYHVYVNDVLQCYNGNSFGMMGGGFGGDQRPDNMEPPEDFAPFQMQTPEGFAPPQTGQLPEGTKIPGNAENMTPPDGFGPSQMGGGRGPGGSHNQMDQPDGSISGKTDFILTETVKSFSGVCDSAQSGKTAVTFRIEGRPDAGELTSIICSDEDLPLDQIQITVTDDPSEDYAQSCLLSDGMDAVNDLLPEDGGNYLLTVAVTSGNNTCTGASQIRFTVADTETIKE